MHIQSGVKSNCAFVGIYTSLQIFETSENTIYTGVQASSTLLQAKSPGDGTTGSGWSLVVLTTAWYTALRSGRVEKEHRIIEFNLLQSAISRSNLTLYMYV